MFQELVFLLAAVFITTTHSSPAKICPLRPCIIPADCKRIILGDPNDPCACSVCADELDEQCEIEGQLYTFCGSACPPTCADPTQFCIKQCVKGCQCPSGTVLDEVTNQCVKLEKCTCPPECSKDFCTRDGNKNARCSVPGPREIPGCTGQCPLIHCGACYYAEEVRDLPGKCGDCGSPVSNFDCLEDWAKCIHQADIDENGEPSPSCITQEKFKCYRYPCQLKG